MALIPMPLKIYHRLLDRVYRFIFMMIFIIHVLTVSKSLESF